MALTPKGKLVLKRLLGVVVIVGALFGLKQLADAGYGRAIREAVIPSRVEIQAFTDVDAPRVAMLPVPGTQPANLAGRSRINFHLAAWNAQIGCIAANGGAVPMEGSLMAQAGVNLHLHRTDSYDQLRAELAKFAHELSRGNANPAAGAHFIAIMGDNAGAWLAELNPMLERTYGAEYRAEVIASCGDSYGEDKLMGPAEWRQNPQAMRGALLAGVVRDGGWNLTQQFLADNGIPNNPDETTYDPDAVNWVNAEDYLDAAQKYIAGYCDEFRVSRGGRRTGETIRKCLDGAVTWTPGDVQIAERKGGVVSVISTREYAGIMPNAIIGIRKWNQENEETVVAMLDAFLRAGAQVRAHPQWLRRGAEASHAFYNEAGTSPEFWETYYRGVVKRDRTGVEVELGGSRASDLSDNLYLFGLAEGTSEQNARYRAIYTGFAEIAKKQYPNLISDYTPYDKAVNTRCLRALVARSAEPIEVRLPTYDEAPTTPTREIGRRDYYILFNTGQASFTPAAERELRELLNALQMNQLRVEVIGHTDNVGDPQMNLQLSDARAMAVKRWLEQQAPAAFPRGRIIVTGEGATKPVADNTTEAGRTRNRRVEIRLVQ
jgi:OmpA-OmpF porin, OOP family